MVIVKVDPHLETIKTIYNLRIIMNTIYKSLINRPKENDIKEAVIHILTALTSKFHNLYN